MKTIYFLLLTTILLSCASSKKEDSDYDTIIKNVILEKKILIDSYYKSISTNVKSRLNDSVYEINSSLDNINNDTLTITFSFYGESGFGIQLVFIDSIYPKAYIYTDNPAYNGHSYKTIELKNFDLVLNKKTFNVGDTLMGKIECLSYPIEELSDKKGLYMKGTLKHIIGKIIRVENGKTYISVPN